MFDRLISDIAGLASLYWPVLVPTVLGMGAVYLLLPRANRLPPVYGAVAGALALLAVGWLLIRSDWAPVETILFYTFAGLAIVFAALMITQRNPVHAALSFAMVVLSTCGLFLLQAAPFLMAGTIIIYAGAIVVTFLFVIMLAQQSGVSSADQRSREPFLATIAGFILLASLLCVLHRSYSGIDDFVARLEQAAAVKSVAQWQEILGDDDKFFVEFRQAVRPTREGQRFDVDDPLTVDRIKLARALDDAQQQWNAISARTDGRPRDTSEAKLEAFKQQLGETSKLALAVRDNLGSLQPSTALPLSKATGTPPNAVVPKSKDGKPKERLPASNVAGLGHALYTDYLLAVELAGTLLLVATIGAIAIAGRAGGTAMTAVGLENYLVVGAILFVLGMIGFLCRRNMILMFLSAEMMLQGVAINLVAFAHYRGNLQGQIFVLFMLTVAACEAAIALALVLLLYKSRKTLDVSVWQDLREADVEPPDDEEPLPTAPMEVPLPRLTKAGPEPVQPREKSHV